MSLSGYIESSINSIRKFSSISDIYSKLKITTYDINYTEIMRVVICDIFIYTCICLLKRRNVKNK
jgi:hypothetical protein